MCTSIARWVAGLAALTTFATALMGSLGSLGSLGPMGSIGLTGSVARAAESVDAPEVAADKLHKQALELFKKGERATAISFWLRANEFHRYWKYSYNLANAYYQEKDYLNAWRFLGEAKQTMTEYLDKLGTLEANIASELRKTHAWVDIQVFPADATVLKDGETWRAPRQMWTTSTAMTLAISAPGYEPLKKDLAFAIGARVVESFVLVPPRRGELVVSGTPAGAIVSVRALSGVGGVGGAGAPGTDVADAASVPVTIGALPTVKVGLPPGRYEVTVDEPLHLPRTATVEVHDEGHFELPIALVKRPVRKDTSGLDGQQVGGIVTAGIGVAAGVVGALLLASADSTATEMRRLNDDADYLASLAGGYESYLAEYDALASKKRTAETAGWVVIGAGGAAILTGVILIATGGERGPPTGRGQLDLRVGLGPGGGMVTVGFGL